MTILSYLLPGLRDLRAPLAAGVLWLAAAWIAWGDSFVASSDRAGTLHHSIELAWNSAGPVGRAAGLVFAAYVVGIAAYEIVERAVGFLRRQVVYPIVSIVGATAGLLGWKVRRGIEGVMHERLEEWVAEWVRETHGVREALQQADMTDRRLAWRIWGERRDLRLQLRLTRPELAEDFDRQSAEAEFRMAIAPPLICIAVLVGTHINGARDLRYALTAAACWAAASIYWSGWLMWRNVNVDRVGLVISGVVLPLRLVDLKARGRRRMAQDPG